MQTISDATCAACTGHLAEYGSYLVSRNSACFEVSIGGQNMTLRRQWSSIPAYREVSDHLVSLGSQQMAIGSPKSIGLP
jgi:hypothetical protein